MAYRAYNKDADLVLHDGAAAITADGSGQDGGSDAELSVGAARFEAVAVVNITACDDGNSDETYELQIRGAAATGMSSAVVLAAVPITRGDTGRLEIPFVNVQYDTVYPFVDLYVDVGGTSPSITFTAFAAPICWG